MEKETKKEVTNEMIMEKLDSIEESQKKLMIYLATLIARKAGDIAMELNKGVDDEENEKNLESSLETMSVVLSEVNEMMSKDIHDRIKEGVTVIRKGDEIPEELKAILKAILSE